MSSGNSGTSHGITGGLTTTLPIAMTIGGFAAIAWYNTVELNLRIWMTFKRYNGLYFYALLASSWGVFFHPLAFIMKDFQVWKNPWVTFIIITLSWYSIVTFK